MKLVVIGGNGFLGSRIGAYYGGKHRVFTPGRNLLDIRNGEHVERYLREIQPDAVIHCAAVSDTGKCEHDPENSWEINVAGSVNVATASRKLGAKCVLCSSDQIYFGSLDPRPHREDEVCFPRNVYGRQKLEMERRCLQENPDSVHLRLSLMYDTVQRPGEHGNFLTTLLENIRLGSDISFPVYDRRGITNVKKVVENMEKALELPGGVYNFGSGNDQSTFETMCTVFHEIGWDLPLQKNTAAFAEAPRNLCMNGDKLREHGILFPATAQGLVEALSELGPH